MSMSKEHTLLFLEVAKDVLTLKKKGLKKSSLILSSMFSYETYKWQYEGFVKKPNL